MVQSMTGFGRSELINEVLECAIEIRSLNNRYLDISVRLPRRLIELESRVKKKIKEKLSRGSIEINISFGNGKKESTLVANLEIAKVYKKILEDLRSSLDIERKIDLKDLLQFQEIIKYEQPEENFEESWNEIEKGVDTAIQKLIETRSIEGNVLLEDILSRIKSIIEKVEFIKGLQHKVVDNYKKKLSERLSKLLDGSDLDQGRLLQEVAIMADRSDISEEIVRLESHLKQFVILTKGHEPIGRQLGFMNQEMFREANTISSKANDHNVSQTVVDIKAELEKIREQIQNIE